MSDVAALPATGTGRDVRPLRPGIVLATLLSCQLLIVLDVTVMNVVLPRIRADLHFGATTLPWVLDAYTLAFGGLLLVSGRAGDLFGRRRLFITGVALFTAASLAGGLAQSPGWLLGARVAQGVGAAMAGPNALALLNTVFTEPKARMRALALYSGMASAGFAVGLILGGLLAQWLGWRAVLFINVPLGVPAVLLAWRYLPVVPRREGRLDLLGALTATGGVAALVYGFIQAATHGWGGLGIDLSLLTGATLLVAFVLVEQRAAQPLLPLVLFADRDRATAYANVFVGYMASMSMFFVLSLFMQDVRDAGPLATGFAFLPTAVLMFAMIRLAPTLLRRFGPKPVTMTGTVLLLAGLLLLTRLTVDTGYFPLVFVATVLMGCGTGLGLMPLAVIIMAKVPSSAAGSAGGAMQTIQQTGVTLGVAILTTVFGAYSRDATRTPKDAMVSGITAAFAAAAVMAALAFLGTFAFRSAKATATATAEATDSSKTGDR
ncbi:EmrB/QacA subfamily drug resistance transporter [Streptomyces sp. 1114.5]|uniref:MFS transporter n=1 Tax=Streptomyces sp. 1114.5 TaxID=1938830 RepID=UPI000EB25E7B|nr:MFS transporter [Streptomyces sp. 1114.5]RKT19018.1 EmrB/QacA subfamily drug resistance transporter [Streptomyces sp. 1114.5]